MVWAGMVFGIWAELAHGDGIQLNQTPHQSSTRDASLFWEMHAQPLPFTRS